MTYVIEVSQMFVKPLFKQFLKQVKRIQGNFWAGYLVLRAIIGCR